mmetsp:Transcript_2538/g.4260  ORF Transcript_2538/g.4260 Transcript_2538/m.4260 type:complete len:97 (-) Transcript_2538:46-336(-)|eukprot:CAMPEP_0168613574 /NCGR_PEP_ID=MMETSP0449_2-20121227/3522_1 /TAXON_ID=1082188 /ORGANISM="Strombidium rassoulzadegani, Strain ras09" /LENGTH=96 /DNA_ID=CAMNT_0008654213 /DNA_START=9 /DNA_END=299 /DNA_ORIENTATION=+
MSFFYYDPRVPDDVFEPKKHIQEELDALKVPMDKRDSCADNYAEFKKCIAVQHSTKSVFSWKKADKEHCAYYFDHWNYCRELNNVKLGLVSTLNSV